MTETGVKKADPAIQGMGCASCVQKVEKAVKGLPLVVEAQGLRRRLWTALFLSGLIRSIRHRTADMNTLVSIGTSTAFFYSALVTLRPGLFAVDRFSPFVYYDTAAMIIALILVGRTLEVRAKGKARQSLRSLMGLQPRSARRIRNGQEEEVPVHGVVIGGASSVDESMLTGESLPVLRDFSETGLRGCRHGV